MGRFATTKSKATAGLLPCFALVDYDPDGLAILLMYRRSLQQIAYGDPILRAQPLHWLGPASDDIENTNDEHKSQVLLPLSDRDRRLAASMMSWPQVEAEGPKSVVRHELQVMLMLNIKFEIQMLDLLPGDCLVDWLRTRMGMALAGDQACIASIGPSS